MVQLDGSLKSHRTGMIGWLFQFLFEFGGFCYQKPVKSVGIPIVYLYENWDDCFHFWLFVVWWILP